LIGNQNLDEVKLITDGRFSAGGAWGMVVGRVAELQPAATSLIEENDSITIDSRQLLSAAERE
jgi:dihydroxyacid dehydratase/phosphogluconate dehydratase